MSAIWGRISYGDALPEDIGRKMRKPYEDKCKIDRYEEAGKAKAFMGCGIQYITREATMEQLPFLDAERQILFAADCILDNRDNLLTELSVSDRNIADGTLMYQAYLRWGIDCLEHFRGLFSIAVYHFDTGVLELASDPVASRCLYYHQTKEGVTFSTLLESILCVDGDIPIHTTFLKDFLIAPQLLPNLVSEDTPYEQVYKLNPGVYLEITREGVTEHSYWHPSMTGEDASHILTAKECGSRFRKLYESCVSDSMRTNGRIGIALSSGLDSSSVGAIAAKALEEKGEQLYAYTYVPFERISTTDVNYVLDEKEDVMKIVKMHPNIVPHFLNTEGRNCLEDIAEELAILEIPFKAYGNMPSLFEMYQHAAEEGCRVVLTGQLGNSTVSYGFIQHILYDLYLSGRYITLLKYANQYALTLKISRKRMFGRYLRMFHKNSSYCKRAEFYYQPDNPFVNTEILKGYPIEERFRQGEIFYTERVLASQKFYRQSLYRKAMFAYLGEIETKIGLHCGVLLRDPTRDMRMLSFCYHMPYRFFAYQGTPRWLIRGNLRDILPTTLLDNWNRYGVQNSDWFLRIQRDWNELRTLVGQELGSDTFASYVNGQEIKKFLNRVDEEFQPEDEDITKYLLILYVLSIFLKNG